MRSQVVRMVAVLAVLVRTVFADGGGDAAFPPIGGDAAAFLPIGDDAAAPLPAGCAASGSSDDPACAAASREVPRGFYSQQVPERHEQLDAFLDVCVVFLLLACSCDFASLFARSRRW
jgi:hypothetical protein